MLERVRANLVQRAGPMDIKQGRVRTDGHLCLKRREAECDVILRREGGPDFNQAREWREPGARDLDSIRPK